MTASTRIIYGTGIRSLIKNDPLGFDVILQRHIARMNADASDEPWNAPKISKFSSTFRWQGKSIVVETNLASSPIRTSVRLARRSSR